MANRYEFSAAADDGLTGTMPLGLRTPGREWLLGWILVLAVMLVYQPVWLAGFIWDDDSVITANPVIVGPLGLKEIWTTQAADICPLVLTSFWCEHALWGLNPLPYHLINLAWHAAGAVVLWRVLLALRIPGAWLGAALWALHPVQVQSVAWITEMKNTQSGVFYLLTILCFVRGLRARADGDRRGSMRNDAGMVVCAALALASKSSTVVLPLVLALVAWWVEGRWHWRNVARLVPIALMALAPVTVTLWTQKLLEQGPETAMWARSWPERVITAGEAVWFYLGKLAWPHPLIFIYPRWQVDPRAWWSILAPWSIWSILFALWTGRATWARATFLAFGYFLAALLPVLGLVDGYFWRYSLVGDHFQYLASMGPLALAGACLARMAETLVPGRAMVHARLCAGLLVLVGLLSWHRTWVYQDVETLWLDTLARNPSSWMAHNNLGDYFLSQSQLELARVQYEQALALNPQEVNAHSNLGIVLSQQEQAEAAIVQFRQALAIRPNFGRALNNLAVTLHREGHLAEALSVYLQAEAVDPYYPEIHTNLGTILLQMGRTDEAITELHQALHVRPTDAEARKQLAVAESAHSSRAK